MSAEELNKRIKTANKTVTDTKRRSKTDQREEQVTKLNSVQDRLV